MRRGLYILACLVAAISGVVTLVAAIALLFIDTATSPIGGTVVATTLIALATLFVSAIAALIAQP